MICCVAWEVDLNRNEMCDYNKHTREKRNIWVLLPIPKQSFALFRGDQNNCSQQGTEQSNCCECAEIQPYILGYKSTLYIIRGVWGSSGTHYGQQSGWLDIGLQGLQGMSRAARNFHPNVWNAIDVCHQLSENGAPRCFSLLRLTVNP
eukprot:scaffold193044_cov40-Prasinocladus_malaysianus.AAC.1